MTTDFDKLHDGDTIDGPSFAVSRESIRLFCDASLDYNPLHLDDEYMKCSFGKTNFGGIIMHGVPVLAPWGHTRAVAGAARELLVR